MLSTEELIMALHCCVSVCRGCVDCPMRDYVNEPGKSTCHDVIMRQAAARLEEYQKGETHG